MKMNTFCRISCLLLCVLLLFSACVHITVPPIGTEPETAPPDLKYVGTNGNYWFCNEDTGEKAEDVPLTDGDLAVYDHSLALAGNRYFIEAICPAGTPLLLWGGFQSGMDFNRYSGVTVRKLTLVASKAGTLTVGTCPVSDFGTDSVHFTPAEQLDLAEGQNVREVVIDVPEGATLVLGTKGDTAQLEMYAEPLPDQGNGTVTLPNGTGFRIPIQVCVGNYEGALLGEEQRDYRGGTTFQYSLAPFIYRSNPFSGTTVTDIAVRTNACKAGDTFTVSAVSFRNMQIKKTGKTVVIRAEEALKAGWQHFTLPEPLPVPEDYTLAFGAEGDTMPVQFYNIANTPFTFYNNTKKFAAYDAGNALGVVVYGTRPPVPMAERDEAVARAVHLLPLSEDQRTVLAEKLQGKKVSIMGDSISTYVNISNSREYNSTLPQNAVFYYSQIPASDTWWRRTIDGMGMTLCVNNSFSGSEVWTGTGRSYLDRAVNLHNDQSGEEPDVIFIFMGTNDERNDQQSLFVPFDEKNMTSVIKEQADGSVKYGNPANFMQAYAIMLDKIMRRYPDAQIFLMTMAPSYLPSDPSGAHLTRYAQLICDIGVYYGLPTVNLVTDTGLTLENIATYSLGDSLHPNKEGMKLISDALLKRMYEFYTAK